MRAEGYLGRGVRGAEPLGLLTSLAIAAFAVAALYFARELFVPLALAIMLSFVLTPPLLFLRRLKVPRILAVGLVVATAFAIIGALGWMMSREATNLAADLPSYQTTLSKKIESFRESTSESGVLKKAGEVLSNLQQQLSAPTEAPPAPSVGTQAKRPDDKPMQVEITSPEPTGWALYQTIFTTLLPPLATAGIVLLLVIFILLQREDLRDRLIRLFGGSDLQRATSTMSDAATRLSHYFLSQVLINFAYGTLIAGALWLIGLPSPFEMRFGNPLDLHGLALKHPGVPIIIPHFGAGMLREALMLAECCPNVHLDTSSSNGWIKYTPGLTLEQVFKTALDVAGPDRLIFGSDSSFFPRGWNGEIYQKQKSALDAIGVGADQQEKIFSGNFTRLFS